jgi:hypothetical protein
MKADNVLAIKYLLLFVAREKKLPQNCTRVVDKVFAHFTTFLWHQHKVIVFDKSFTKRSLLNL